MPFKLNHQPKSESDITKATFDLLEFDRLSQQGTNDSNSIKERVRIMKEFLKIIESLNPVDAESRAADWDVMQFNR